MKKPGTISARRSKDGTIRHRVRLWVNGKQETIGTYDTPEEAAAALAIARRDLLPQRTAVGISLLAYGAAWLDRREADGLHRSVKDSRSVWKTHLATWELAAGPMRRIKRTDVVAWVKSLLRKEHAGRRLARQTVLNAFNLLHRMLGDAADEGKVSSNVASGVKVPSVPREDEPWTWLRADEIEALLALELTPAQRAIWTVAIYTGLRPGEIFGLRWCDVTETELVVRRSYAGPTKKGRVRRVPLLPAAKAALKAWRSHKPGVGGALVFPGAPTHRYPDFKGCHAKGFAAGFEDVIGKVVEDRPVRFYDLRHTCASHLVQGTWLPMPLRLEDVQLWLGHRSRTTTERYAHLCPDRLHGIVRAAIEKAEENG